jgi:hypothetical protein
VIPINAPTSTSARCRTLSLDFAWYRTSFALDALSIQRNAHVQSRFSAVREQRVLDLLEKLDQSPLELRYRFESHALVAYISDVTVLRADKF